MTTLPGTPAGSETKESLETEATELQDDIKETKAEAAAARQDGDDARATRLEASIAKTQADLDEIKTLLKGITDRPFAPAPGDDEPPAAKDETKPDETKTDETKPDDKPKKKHWLYGDRWNQE